MVPAAELQPYSDGGPVTKAILAYHRTLAGWRERGLDKKADAHEALFEKLMTWRQEEAERLRLAPVTVLPDHLAMAIVKVKPLGVDALHAIGVRLAGAQALLGVIDAWRAENDDVSGPSQASQGASTAAAAPGATTASPAAHGGNDGGGGSGAASDAPLPIPAGMFMPPQAWALAKPLPPAGKKGEPPASASRLRTSGAPAPHGPSLLEALRSACQHARRADSAKRLPRPSVPCLTALLARDPASLPQSLSD